MMTSLRRARRDAKLTQRQLAAKSKVSRRTIVSIESGRRCQMTTKRKILRALGLEFERWPEVFRERV